MVVTIKLTSFTLLRVEISHVFHKRPPLVGDSVYAMHSARQQIELVISLKVKSFFMHNNKLAMLAQSLYTLLSTCDNNQLFFGLFLFKKKKNLPHFRHKTTTK